MSGRSDRLRRARPGFDINTAQVENVAFAFGTNPEIVLIPLPPAFPLGLAGLASVVFVRRLSRSVWGKPDKV